MTVVQVKLNDYGSSDYHDYWEHPFMTESKSPKGIPTHFLKMITNSDNLDNFLKFLGPKVYS